MTGVFEGVGTLQFSPDNKYAYIYSGEIEAKTASQTALSFFTNSEYLVGEFTLNAFIQLSNISTRQAGMSIKINNVIVANQFTSDASEDLSSNAKQKIIIPPFSSVICDVVAASDDSDNFSTVVFTGKVKGAIEQENLEAITDNSKWASK